MSCFHMVSMTMLTFTVQQRPGFQVELRCVRFGEDGWRQGGGGRGGRIDGELLRSESLGAVGHLLSLWLRRGVGTRVGRRLRDRLRRRSRALQHTEAEPF